MAAAEILLTNYYVYDCKFCREQDFELRRGAREIAPEEIISLTLDCLPAEPTSEGLVFKFEEIIQSPPTTTMEKQLVAVARGLRTRASVRNGMLLDDSGRVAVEIMHEA